MRHTDTAVVIPVYNEAKVIKGVVEKVLKTFSKVICVNDGSSDNSSEAILSTRAILVEHPINLGQGAALQTAIEQALKDEAIKYIITFDADGQHSINDAENMLKVIKSKKVDIVLGSRFLGHVKNMPFSKKILLKAAVSFTNRFSGVKLTDTHNGLRVFNRVFAKKIDITAPDMAHASEIIDKIGNGEWHYEEVPITIAYSDYSKAKGQSIINSVNILFDLFLSRTRK